VNTVMNLRRICLPVEWVTSKKNSLPRSWLALLHVRGK
jgi:hypothetical protein